MCSARSAASSSVARGTAAGAVVVFVEAAEGAASGLREADGCCSAMVLMGGDDAREKEVIMVVDGRGVRIRLVD